MQLKQVTSGKCGMINSKIDEELCMKHVNGKLEVLMTKHVDDLKMTGNPNHLKYILQELQKVFCELNVEWHSFTNCGVRHYQDTCTKEITLWRARRGEGASEDFLILGA